MNDKEKREAIIKIIDEEDAWVHVIMNYVGFVRNYQFTKWKKDGTIDTRQNMGKLALKLNHAIGDVIALSDPKK